MINAVIFDMDGLMANTEPVHWRAYATVFQQLGKTFPVEDNRKYFVGMSDLESSAAMVKHYSLPISPQELQRRKEMLHHDFISSIEAQPGLYELLGALTKHHLKMAIASGSTRASIDRVLEILRVEEYFAIRCSANDVARGKPDPEVFLLAARKLGTDPSACLVLEDSAKGIEAATRANMLSIAIPTPETQGGDFSKATHKAASLHEVFPWITSFNRSLEQ